MILGWALAGRAVGKGASLPSKWLLQIYEGLVRYHSVLQCAAVPATYILYVDGYLLLSTSSSLHLLDSALGPYDGLYTIYEKFPFELIQD